MRFTPQFLDELKARLPVSEVVGRRVKLVRSGREFKGLSPFNKEKTPSFFVNDQKQAWFDFSSGKNGSIFDFIMETEGVSFPEAVERLAQLAGVPLPQVSREDVAREAKRKSLYDVMELAAKFFEATLAARAGAKARGYLADRGLDPATQLKFRLGYAPPERFALKEHLGSHGVPVEDMIEAGLLVHGDDIPVPYDRFRDRVMFPITDWRGRLIAFGGRALYKDAPAKYLNSPETPLFHKGGTLYNIAAARQAAHEGAQVVVVEGYVDVIAMVTAGFPAAVAPLGTALTEDQLGLLWKMADEPVLCFDGDKAGVRAAYRAVDLAMPRLKPGKSLKFALLPEGQDPDDLLRSAGREAVNDVIAAAGAGGPPRGGGARAGARAAGSSRPGAGLAAPRRPAAARSGAEVARARHPGPVPPGKQGRHQRHSGCPSPRRKLHAPGQAPRRKERAPHPDRGPPGQPRHSALAARGLRSGPLPDGHGRGCHRAGRRRARRRDRPHPYRARAGHAARPRRRLSQGAHKGPLPLQAVLRHCPRRHRQAARVRGLLRSGHRPQPFLPGLR
jgi:DNA primase catalytic core